MIETHSLHQILESAPFGCVILSTEGQIEALTPEALRILGCTSSDQMAGKMFGPLIQPDQQVEFEAFIHVVEGADEAPGWVQFNLGSGAGDSLPVYFQGKRRVNDDDCQAGVLLYLLSPAPRNSLGPDMNDHPGVGGEKNQNNKYETIFESATVGIGVLDEDGYFDEVNQIFSDYFNLPKDSFLNTHYTQVFAPIALGKIKQLIDMARIEDVPHVKNVVTIETSAGNHRILEFSLASMLNAYEDSTMLMMIVEDITNQQDTHKALIQSEKLALTGRLAASLAHEINNPLQTSIGCLGLAEEMLVDDDRDLKVYVTMAIEELRRSARIVKKLRDLNRKTDQTERFPVDLQKVIEGVLVLTQNKLVDRDIQPVLTCQGPRPILMASRDQIQQVILNLMMNAIDALPSGGMIYLEIARTQRPSGVTVKIRDTGVGIQPENLRHLFDPFFTTKTDGLGLGLYICKTIIEDHHGSLEVESEPGVGTEFSIWLPGLETEGIEE